MRIGIAAGVAAGVGALGAVIYALTRKSQAAAAPVSAAALPPVPAPVFSVMDLAMSLPGPTAAVAAPQLPATAPAAVQPPTSGATTSAPLVQGSEWSNAAADAAHYDAQVAANAQTDKVDAQAYFDPTAPDTTGARWNAARGGWDCDDPGKEWNDIWNHCIQKCPAGQVRNPATAACETPGANAPTVFAHQCPPGYDWVEKSQSCQPPCSAGQVRDPGTGACGTRTEVGDGCPEGTVRDYWGNCICGNGYVRDASGTCVPSPTHWDDRWGCDSYFGTLSDADLASRSPRPQDCLAQSAPPPALAAAPTGFAGPATGSILRMIGRR